MQSRNGAIARRTPEGRGNGKKATKAEKEQRIQRAMMLIVQGCPKSEIKKAFRDAWGLGWYQIERYISYARERLAEETGLTDEFTLDDMKRQHYAMAIRIAREDSGYEAKDRLAALKHAGAIYGVLAPKKIAPTTPYGTQPYELKVAAETALRGLSVEELRILKKVKQRMTAIIENGNRPGVN